MTPKSDFDWIELLPDPVLVVDARFQLSLINHAARQQWPGARPGTPFALLLRSPELLSALHHLTEAQDISIRDPRSPDRWLKVRLTPGPHHQTLITVHDETEAHLQNARHRDFVANASHELKTPLASLAGMLELIALHHTDDPAVVARFLPALQAQTTRMQALIEDLLSLNRIAAQVTVAPRQRLDLRPLLHESLTAVSDLNPETPRKIDDQRTGPAEVMGDAGELRRAMVNLMENALHHGRGAPVILRLWADPTQTGYVAISVCDQGPGIARAYIPRLTERFYRVPGARLGGTGLGLAIVKHVVAHHRGKLTIESELGKGSCFTLWLPLAADQASQQQL